MDDFGAYVHLYVRYQPFNSIQLNIFERRKNVTLDI